MHYASSPGCWGYQGGTWTPPSLCTAAPVAAGLVFYATARRQSVMLAFACPEHVAELIAARPLHERDRAEMARRYDRQARRQPDGVEPLAVGREARELVERARRWAAAHPGLTYTAAPVASTPPALPTSPGRPFDAYASNSSSGGVGGVLPPEAGQQGR